VLVLETAEHLVGARVRNVCTHKELFSGELFGIAPKLDFAKPCLLQKVKFLLFFNSRLKFCERNLRKFFYDPMGFIKVRKKAIHYCAR